MLPGIEQPVTPQVFVGTCGWHREAVLASSDGQVSTSSQSEWCSGEAPGIQGHDNGAVDGGSLGTLCTAIELTLNTC